jgi:hypothetical protein
MNCYTSFRMWCTRALVGVLSLTIGLAACGGSLHPGSGPDASTTIPCAAMGACECMAASDRCAPRTEACWCPSECNPQIACICGGGQFLACEDRSVVTVCSEWLTAVQSKCAGQPFVQYLDSLCVETRADPICTAGCLANLKDFGSCAEIDCSFCPVCDCAEPATPSPFAACLQACRTPLADRL